MLRRFLYLDSAALTGYVAALEGGTVTESVRRSVKSGQAEGGVDAKVASARGSRGHEEESTHTLADTDEARFERLLLSARARPDDLGWVEVLDPDRDLSEANVGMMVSWECDIYVPPLVRALSPSGEGRAALEMMQTVLPLASALGMDVEGMPKADQLSAMTGLVGTMKSQLVAVGEDSETDWRVAGSLRDEFVERTPRAVLSSSARFRSASRSAGGSRS